MMRGEKIMGDQASNSAFLGRSVEREELLLKLADRHELVTSATGTGKTVTTILPRILERILRSRYRR
jgi:hypothetical protein